MFIPNKTFHAIRAWLLGLIVVLVAIIAWQSSVSATTAKVRKAEVDSLQVALDTQADATVTAFRNTERWQAATDDRLTALEGLVSQQGQTLVQLQGTIDGTRLSVDKLLRNECTPETAIYVLTRDMVAVCRTLGVLPP